ncbi:MAG: response regulator [Spirochaetes bacterium]|nr:response regulator [Spirochaetota bacterium]
MGKKILYIEDNEQNYYLVQFILKHHEYEVLWAKDGKEGIEMAARIQPDLILLDIQLPIVDGYAVAKAIRRNPQLEDIPIVALTSYAMLGDREKAIEAGCTGYIEKPIKPEIFANQIKAYFEKNEIAK